MNPSKNTTFLPKSFLIPFHKRKAVHLNRTLHWHIALRHKLECIKQGDDYILAAMLESKWLQWLCTKFFHKSEQIEAINGAVTDKLFKMILMISY